MKIFPTLPEDLLPWMVKVLFYGLKTIGLAPLSIQFKTRAGNSRYTFIKVFLFSRIGLLYNLILAIVIAIVGVLLIVSISFPEYLNEPSLYGALDLMVHILSIFTSWFIVVYLAFKQKKATIIMNRLLDIHFLLSSVRGQLFNKRSYIFSSLKMASHVLLWALALSTDIIVDPSLRLVAFDSTNVIMYFFVIEYSIILGLVVGELEILNQNLSNLNDFPSYSFRTSLPHEQLAGLSSPTRSQLTTLKLLHSIRTTLYELSQDIAELFSLPMLLTVACNLFSLVEAFFFLVVLNFVRNIDSSPIFHINTATWILKSVLPLILLALNVTDIAKKANQTGQILHTLLATVKNQEIRTELQQFSLHLMHEDVSITAHDFFTLDFTLLRSIFGATAAYLVIVFQYEHSADYHH